jgi:hypothetical protein
VYGKDSKFRRLLESEGLGYVVAVSSGQRAWVGLKQVRVDALAGDLPSKAWRRLSCGAGSKGQRIYDWAFVGFPFQSDDEIVKGLPTAPALGPLPAPRARPNQMPGRLQRLGRTQPCHPEDGTLVGQVIRSLS